MNHLLPSATSPGGAEALHASTPRLLLEVKKLSGVRGSRRRPDKMLQNDMANSDNEFHVSQS